jgi:hypothetical protein
VDAVKRLNHASDAHTAKDGREKYDDLQWKKEPRARVVIDTKELGPLADAECAERNHPVGCENNAARAAACG